MTQKALLQSAGDGTAVPAGYVGQSISITGSIVVPTNTNTTILASNETPQVGVYLWIGNVVFSHSSSVSVGNYVIASIIDYQSSSLLAVTTQVPSKPALSGADISLAFSTVFNATGSNKPTLRLESFAGTSPTCSFLSSRLIRIA